MEKRTFKYIFVAMIFFVGLSLGSVRIEKNPVQDKVDDFEEVITEPNNEYDGVFPEEQYTIKYNFLTAAAKDGEKLVTKIIDVIFDGGEKLFQSVLGI